MPTRHLPPTQSGPARPPGKPPRRSAEPRAAVVPPPVRPEPAPGMPSQRWKTRTNPWLRVRGVGARLLPATSTLPTRPAGRAGAAGPTVIQTCVPSRRAKAVASHAPAVVPMSGRHLAAVGSTAPTGMSRPRRPSTSVGTGRMSLTNPTSPPTRLRGVVAPLQAGQTAPIRRTTRSRGSATAARPPSTSQEPSREPSHAPNAGVDHGRHASLRPNPGSTTSKPSATDAPSEHRPDLAGQSEHQCLLGCRHRLHHVIAVVSEPLQHTSHQNLGYGCARGDTYRRRTLQP
jgi:hypothetical protein